MPTEIFSSRILVILPVLDEEENLIELIPRLISLGEYITLLVVDSCSTDKSLDIVRYFQSKYKGRIFIGSQPKNMGRGAAVKLGYNFSIERKFDYVIEMDADLSHQPEDIPSLLKESALFDIIIGSRLIKGGSMRKRIFIRNIITYAANFYLKHILHIKAIKDLTSGFRCIKVDFLRRINISCLESSGPQLLQEIIFKNKDRISVKEVPIVFMDRYKGKTKFGLSIILKSLYFPFQWRIENLFLHFS